MSRGTSGWSAISGWSGTFPTTSSCWSPSGSLNVSASPVRATGTPWDESRSAQKSSASGEPTRQTIVDHPGARAPRRRARVLEEGDVRARAPLLVRVEQVVDGRIVLVDRLLDHAQAEGAGVELDVLRSVAGDVRHVMDAVESHGNASGRDTCGLKY
jgi:hypothetical protein